MRTSIISDSGGFTRILFLPAWAARPVGIASAEAGGLV